mmetsp:Transcript_10220/g.25531  ORF Transcript_10220/g.25531 Transcript_10220/m.25531 type:complete len:303 (+) Transcript_10220:80-988(+)
MMLRNNLLRLRAKLGESLFPAAERQSAMPSCSSHAAAAAAGATLPRCFSATGEGAGTGGADMEAEARRQLEAVRDQMEEDSLDKQVRAQNLPDDVASGVATFLEEEEGGSLGKAGAKNWLMLSGLAKAVIPVDVIGFLKEHGVAHKEIKVKLDRQLGVSEWFVCISSGDVSTAVRKLRGKHLGLLPVSVQLLNEEPQMLEQILPQGEEYVSLTNVPTDTTWQDVKDFFRGYNIRHNGIVELQEKLLSSPTYSYVYGKEETKRFLVQVRARHRLLLPLPTLSSSLLFRRETYLSRRCSREVIK